MRRAPDAPFAPGNRCTLLRDGRETFPAMLAAIAQARRFVHLEVFRFRDDRLGRAFEAELTARARAGVEVRVLVDGYGSIGTPWAFFDRLLRAGGQLAVFRPVAPWRKKWGFYRRDHRKILVVDGRVGFTGGLNLDLCHASVEDGGAGWRDTHLRVEGPAVVELDRHFWDTWFSSATQQECPSDLSRYAVAAAEAGTHAVQVVANGVVRRGRAVRRAYLEAISGATRRAWLTNPYFLPDAVLVRALTDAVARGVDVRVLVPGRSDVLAVDLASRPILRALSARGVRVFRRVGTILHAKTAVVDGEWSTVGSTNLDALSLDNLELNVNVRDASFGTEMEQAFLEDLRAAEELREPERPRAHWRLVEWTFHGLRGWM